MQDGSNQPTNPTAPPYVSFLTFLNLLDWLEKENIPLRFDRDMWGNKFSGSNGAQLMAALRFLNLINGAQTKPDLERLVTARGDARKSVLLDILRKSYPSVMFDQLPRATPSMLREWLDIYRIDGDTRRKAESFLINALKFAGQNLSPSLSQKARIRRPKPASDSGTSAKSSSQSPKTPSPNEHDSQSSTRVIQLNSGGEVGIRINVDLFDLSPTDREFVLSLIDQVQSYSSEPITAPSEIGGDH